MKKVLIPLFLIVIAGLMLNAQNKNYRIQVKQGSNVIDNINVNDLDTIRFQELSGAPDCEIEIPAMQKTINRSAIGNDYEITVSYSKNMKSANLPKISFSPASAANTLTVQSSNWDDAECTSYTWIYKISDANQQRIVPDITVTGGVDIYGNAQNICTLDSALVIDTELPNITSLTFPSYQTICDGAVGDKFIIRMKFNEEMKTAIAPEITFSPDITGRVFDSEHGGWEKDNMTYIDTFIVIDNNEKIPAVTSIIINAVDKAGNKMVSYSTGKTLKVDTQNPKVSSLAATIPDIKQEHVNSQITITVNYNEYLVGSYTPIIEFSPSLNDVLQKENGSWTAPYTYVQKYKVKKGFNQNIEAVDVKVKNARDSCGNEQVEYTKADYINVLMAITEVFREGFATYVKGSPVYFPWTRASNGVTNEIDDSYFNSDSVSLKTEGSVATSKTESVYRDFTASPDGINVEFCLRPDSESDSASIALVHRATGDVSCAFIIARDGKAYLRSGNTSEVITWPSDNPYVGNLFSCYRMNYNKLTGVASLYYNNVLAKTVTATVPANLYNSIYLNTYEGVVHWDTLVLWY